MRIFIHPNPLRYFLLSVTIAIVTFGLIFSSCTDYEQESVPVPDRTAVIYLNFKTGASSKPAAEMNTSQSAETRAPMLHAIDENGINTVDVLSFKVDPADPTNIKKGTFFYCAQGTYNAGTQTVRVQLLGASEHQTLVILANVREQVNTLAAALGEQKEMVMSRLLLPVTSDGMPDLTNGMPMWGELPDQAINETYAQSSITAPTVTMIRSLVKITYKEHIPQLLSPDGGNLWYNGIKFLVYNHRSKGCITPNNFQVIPLSVSTPTIPIGATGIQGVHHTLLDHSALTGSGGEESFYMFEADNSKVNSGSALDATCLVVQFLGGPASGWHRLDFRDYMQPPGSGFMDLLRGYHYVIEPKEWDGSMGAATPEEALKGKYTLKCKIVPWNEVQGEVKADGNKRLKVDKRIFSFPGDPNVTGETGGTQTLTLSTENTGGWRIDGKPDWVTLSQNSGTDGTPATVTLTVGVEPRTYRPYGSNESRGR